MSTHGFIPALAIGGALLALWVEVRFPKLAPSGLGHVFLNIVAAVLCMRIAGELVVLAADQPALYFRFAAVFLLALPALTYVFLSSIWVLRLMQSSLSGSMR